MTEHSTDFHGFEPGDRVRVTEATTGNSLEATIIVCDEGHPSIYADGGFGQHLDDALAEEDLTIEKIASIDEVLPTAPGQYKEVTSGAFNEALARILGVLDDEDFEMPSQVWTLNEDGTWTDPEGTTKPKEQNYLLVASGYQFEPVGEGTPDSGFDTPAS